MSSVRVAVVPGAPVLVDGLGRGLESEITPIRLAATRAAREIAHDATQIYIASKEGRARQMGKSHHQHKEKWWAGRTPVSGSFSPWGVDISVGSQSHPAGIFALPSLIGRWFLDQTGVVLPAYEMSIDSLMLELVPEMPELVPEMPELVPEIPERVPEKRSVQSRFLAQPGQPERSHTLESMHLGKSLYNERFGLLLVDEGPVALSASAPRPELAHAKRVDSVLTELLDSANPSRYQALRQEFPESTVVGMLSWKMWDLLAQWAVEGLVTGTNDQYRADFSGFGVGYHVAQWDVDSRAFASVSSTA